MAATRKHAAFIAGASTIGLGLIFGVVGPAQAQTAQTAPPVAEAATAELPREEVTIGLSSDVIEIATDFSGMDLTIFGSVNNPRIDSVATGGYDIVVVLEGPPRPLVVREKRRVFGMWVNADAVAYEDVQRSYVLAATARMQDIASDEAFQQLALGVEQRFFKPANESEGVARLERFSAALKARKIAAGLYHEGEGSVRFLSQSLFKATLALPANIPLGTHRARAFLFRNGAFLDEDSTGLYVTKDSFEQWVFNQARENGFLYGWAAVLLAVAVGWLGRVLFKRD
ncbi:MAG: TIGR02186 family protein [Phyllobacteriaceae bacterium]|nr:TIGR02186 family protein [Phyllobacteriaceae bacterium]